MKVFIRNQCVRLSYNAEAGVSEGGHVRCQCVGRVSLLAGNRMVFDKSYPYRTHKREKSGYGEYASKLPFTESSETFLIEAHGNLHEH